MKERASNWSMKRQTSLGGTYPFSTVNWETHPKATNILRSQCLSPSCHHVMGQKTTKALALLLVHVIVPTVTGYFCGVSLILNALVAGNGSYILWPSVALT